MRALQGSNGALPSGKHGAVRRTRPVGARSAPLMCRVRSPLAIGCTHASSSAGPAQPGEEAAASVDWAAVDRRDATSTASTSSNSASTSSSSSSSSSGSDRIRTDHLPREMLAAMALSPFAALALPLVSDPAWRESAARFGERVRYHLQATAASDGVRQAWAKLDSGITYMDWTWDVTGIDFSRIWDAELWVRLKQAVMWGEPNFFWNALFDRIQYRDKVPGAGMVGDMRISYAKFLALLEAKRVKRVIVYGDMKTAVVEVPHRWCASMSGAPGAYPWIEKGLSGKPQGLLVPDPAFPDDPSRWWSPEMPEWDMEKYRLYVDLPGDFWDSGVLLEHLKANMVQVVWDAASKQYVVPYAHLTRLGEVRTELQLLDPSENWQFLSWLMSPSKMDFYEKTAAVCLFIRGIAIATNIISATALVRFVRKKVKKKSKKESTWERLTRAPAREFMSKDKDGKTRDTGVRFADIAGMDDIVFEMREVVKMLLQDPAYMRVGARPPKGIIFQGPPGTGKTYLARAIAGEAGITFLSAVGSEFVEMFAGVAAARVNSLYYTARKKSPCIIFIDEVDAIGRSRTTLGNDPGSMERESALLAMLVQMDGIHGELEQVLTIGATNLATELDQALLRPGRFEAVYEIPSPNPTARLEILTYHARNKPLADPSILVRVAEVTQGWSAAALANLMNEAAILTVRRGVKDISLPMVLDVVNAQEWGPTAPRIPPSEAKNRLALVTAAKAVAFALTPGVDPIKYATMWSRRRGQGPTVEFLESEANLSATWHPEQIEIMDRATNFKVNAAAVGDEPLGEFLHVAGLLLPLYAPRALELLLWGEDGASLATAAPIADCFELAYYCCRNSMLHPKFKRLPPLHTYIWLGNDALRRNQRDPLALGLDEQLGYHKLTLTLLKAAWRRTQKMVAERRTAIVQVAEEMMAAEDERISGERLVEIIETTPLDATDITIESDFLPLLKSVLGNVPGIILEGQAAAAADEAAAAAAAEPPAAAEGAAAAADADAARGAGRGAAASFSRGAGVGCVAFECADGAAAGAPAAAPPPPPPPAIRVDDSTLTAVSRAIMGRLDIVDLIGRNTATDVAERVADALLHPETVERLRAVREYADSADAPFPPVPGFDQPGTETGVPAPVYGWVPMGLDWWKQRRIRVVTWDAVEMLFSERSRRHYYEDQPQYEGPKHRAQQREAAAAAGRATSEGGGSDDGSGAT